MTKQNRKKYFLMFYMQIKRNKQMSTISSGLVELLQVRQIILSVSPECLADFLTSLKHWISVNYHLFT